MAVTPAVGPYNAVALSTAQTGNADSTNTVDRADRRGPGAVVITNVDGGTGTVKVDIKGSVDGTNFYNVAYALVATPTTVTVAQLTITTATTTTYLLVADQAWRYLKLTLSSNTNETITASAYV